MNTGLKDKVVIVTGGSAGIGKATALRFAREGSKIVIWDLERSPVISELEKMGSEVQFKRVDVSQADSVATGFSAVMERFGGVDVLVNNAGIVRDAQLVKYRDNEVKSRMSEDVFDQVIGVNLKGVFLCTREVVPTMIEAGGGVILNASSVAGLHGNFGQTNYSATKIGVISFTHTWARELGKFGIRVNAVAPGFIHTEILDSMPKKVLEAMVNRTPVGRMGKVSDIAEAYLWLASDAATFVHGAVLSVDGGLVLGT